MGQGRISLPDLQPPPYFLPLREKTVTSLPLMGLLQASQTTRPERLLFAECYSKQLPAPHRSGTSHTFTPASTTQLPSLPQLFSVHTIMTCSLIQCTYSFAAFCRTGGLKKVQFIGHICSLVPFSSNKSSFCLGP